MTTSSVSKLVLARLTEPRAAEDVAKLTRLPLDKVRKSISNLVYHQRVANLGKKNGVVLYEATGTKEWKRPMPRAHIETPEVSDEKLLEAYRAISTAVIHRLASNIAFKRKLAMQLETKK